MAAAAGIEMFLRTVTNAPLEGADKTPKGQNERLIARTFRLLQ
jgi:hypothetical protein